MKYIILTLLSVCLVFISGCGPSREELKNEVRAEVMTELKVDQAELVEYKKKEDKLKEVDVKPKAGESRLDALIREKQETIAEMAVIKEEISQRQKLLDQGDSKLKALTAAVKEAELDRLRFWANLVGGIAAGLAIILAVASFFTSGYPILPRILRYCALSLGAISVLSFGFAAIVGYLTIIGISLGVIIIGAGLYFWFKDRKSLGQVVTAVEKVKHQLPNYKDEFNKIIDSDVDLHVDEVRSRLKKIGKIK